MKADQRYLLRRWCSELVPPCSWPACSALQSRQLGQNLNLCLGLLWWRECQEKLIMVQEIWPGRRYAQSRQHAVSLPFSKRILSLINPYTFEEGPEAKRDPRQSLLLPRVFAVL